MDFRQFTVNFLVLDRANDNIQEALDMLINDDILIEMFGERFRELN